MVSNNSINNTIADNDFSVNRATAGTTVTNTVAHSDNSNTGSHALLEAISGGASGGDPGVHFLVTGAGEFSAGIDNSDSDLWKLTSGATPSAGTDLITSTSAGIVNLPDRLRIGDSSVTQNRDLNIQKSTNAGPVIIEIRNTDNASDDSTASLEIANGGASGGDVYTTYNKAGFFNWTTGIDITDAGKFIIGYDAGGGISPSTVTPYMTFTTAGEIRMPLQPAFSAYLGTQDDNKTGQGAVYTMGASGTALTELYDINSDFDPATGIFTAPVTGIYIFHGGCLITGCTAAAQVTMRLDVTGTSADIYFQQINRTNSSIDLGGIFSRDIFMTATDTATMGIVVIGEASDIDDIGVGVRSTFFTGRLAC